MRTRLLCRLTAVFAFTLCATQLTAQVIISSVVPARGATGVSPSAAVVFTFSGAMDTTATTATILDNTIFGFPPYTTAWSAGDTVLTCTPSPSWPDGHNMAWFVSGASVLGDSLNDASSFTVAGVVGGGSGTNAITTFTVGKVHFYNQVSTAAPVLDSLAPYNFSATTSLASNRTSTGIALTFPNNAVSNLTQNFLHPESYYLFASTNDLTAFNTGFPSGTYQFTVFATSSNQTVNVNLPGSLVQPNAPHISNWTAAQSVNPALPFTLNWDSFSGGTASDFISVAIGQTYATPSPGLPGALSGTATSVQIPAATLVAGSNYDCSIGFYHVSTTSNTTYATLAYVATSTRFTLSTTSGTSSPLVLTNAIVTSSNFTFEVVCSPSQPFVVESSSNLLAGSWSSLLSTNPTGNRVRVSAPRSPTAPRVFFRAHH